jgi:hypothetical protein
VTVFDRLHLPPPDGTSPAHRLMGFSSTLWMAVGWLIVIVVIFFPFPWWGW